MTFSGGFAIQQDFAWLTGIEEASVKEQAHNMELYFEEDDFDAFCRSSAHMKMCVMSIRRKSMNGSSVLCASTTRMGI